MFLTSPSIRNPLSSSQSPKLPTPQPRFGCRLAGMMAHADAPEADCFVKSVATQLPKIADSKTPFIAEAVSPMASLLRKDQSDGWGHACFVRDGQGDVKLDYVKSHESIIEDKQFPAAQEQLLKKKPQSGIWHARRATDPKGPSNENAHPFHLKMDGADWVFAHNGNWEQAIHPDIKKHLAENSAFTPKGVTDSEHAFRFLMRSVRQQLGTLNLGSPKDGNRQENEKKMIRALAQGIRKLNQRPGKFISLDIPDTGLGITGKVRVSPAYNFLLHDKHMMVAYRHGQSLYLGVQRNSAGKPIAHAVATVPFKTPDTTWTDILDDTMVIIRRDPKTGASQAKILPMEDIPPLAPRETSPGLAGQTVQTQA